MPKASREVALSSNALFERESSFAVGEVGAKLAGAFESEAATPKGSREILAYVATSRKRQEPF